MMDESPLSSLPLVLRMQSDRKIGFAMGILLIGVVAAPFFRNEPLPVAEQLSHPRRQQLNQRLRDREVAVYIPDEEPLQKSAQPDNDSLQWTLHSVIEEFDQQSRQSPAPVHDDNGRRSDLENQNRQSLDGYRTWRPGRQPQSAPKSQSAPKPQPVEKVENRVAESRDESTPAAVTTGLQKLLRPTTERAVTGKPLPPLHVTQPAIAALRSPTSRLIGAGSAPTDDDEVLVAAGAPDRDDPPSNASDFDEHTVQFGETLSSIAAHYFGSQSHYRRIFEANRDRLSSPDKLKVGMRLRIPSAVAQGH